MGQRVAKLASMYTVCVYMGLRRGGGEHAEKWTSESVARRRGRVLTRGKNVRGLGVEPVRATSGSFGGFSAVRAVGDRVHLSNVN